MTSGPPDIDPNASGTPEPEVTPVAVTAAAAAQGPSRPAALAGRFYAGEAERLAAEVDGHLKAARRERKSLEIPAPKALIAPHAGHVYSGPTAARAYIRLDPVRSKIKRVVLFGPTHHVGFTGLALSGAGSFETPLGSIPVDRAWEGRLQGMASVGVMKEAHSKEHSLEVHLPFLQRVLGDFALVPVVCGRATPEAVAKVMEVLWGGPETLVVVSTDLSHFLDYMTCRSKDAGTAAAIEALNTEVIGPQEACGHIGVKGLMTLAKQRNLKLKRIDVCNSGDTAGDKGRVVGYGAWSLTEPLGGMKTQQSAVETAERIVTDHGAKLLSLAARAIRHGHRH
ncbi:MAG: AmmeMemoRadiSam system protein B, partial [Rhodospirillaceae bacterium]